MVLPLRLKITITHIQSNMINWAAYWLQHQDRKGYVGWFYTFEMMQSIYSIQIKGVYIWKWTIPRGFNFSNRWYEHYPKMLSNSNLGNLDRIRRKIISRQNPFTLNKVRLRWAKNEIPDQNLKNKLWPQLFVLGNVTVSIGQVSVELTSGI